MGTGQGCLPDSKVKRRWCISGIAALLLLLVALVVVVPSVVVLVVRPQQFKSTFIARCETFSRYNCPNIWSEFEKAYVWRDACDVPEEAYDDYISAANVEPLWNNTMFWHETKGLVHEFTRNSRFRTLEDILLGNVVDNLTWCGARSSSITFTTGCPECPRSAVNSFWNTSSRAFARAAHGTAAVMLNGFIETPFTLDSVFGSIEVKNLNPAVVTSMTVVLVTGKNSVATCSNPSLQLLKTELKSIAYDCKEVTEERIRECAANSIATCW